MEADGTLAWWARRPWRGRWARGWSARGRSGRRRVAVFGGVAAVVVVLVAAVVAGGGSGSGSGAASAVAVAPATAAAVAPGTPATPTGAGDSADSAARAASGGVAASAAASGSAASGPAASPNAATDSGASSSVPGIAPRIVRDGTVDLVVRRGGVGPALDALAALATGFGGYPAASSSSVAGSGSASITLRVPSASFDKLRAGVAKLGDVRGSTTTSQDVTSQYVDLQARERALSATRDTYLTMLSKATTIGDTLAVQQRLDDVQVQLEQLEGQRRVLADQSDLATLTVTVAERGAPVTKPSEPPTGFAGAWHRSWSRFTRGLEAIVALIGPLALVGLAIAVLVVAVRLTRRWRRPPTALPSPDPAP